MFYTQKSAEEAFRDIVRVNTPFNLLCEYFSARACCSYYLAALKLLQLYQMEKEGDTITEVAF